MNLTLPMPRTFPLTMAQRAIWLDQVSRMDSPLYNIGGYLEFNGPLRADVLQRALELLVDKHDVLRTVLLDETDADGVPLQCFVSSLSVKVPLYDFSGQADPLGNAQALIQEQMARVYDLARAPLFDFFLIKLGEAHYYLANQAHHLILDGWGFSQVMNSFGGIYSALVQGRQPDLQAPSYVGFILEDDRYRKSPRYARDRHYWQEKYPVLPPLLLVPRSRDRQVKDKAASGHRMWPFTLALHERMGELAKGCGASTFHVLLAALSVYFTRTAQRDEWVVGLPLLNRSSASFKVTAGMFTQVSAVRFNLGPSLSFAEVVRAVRGVLKRDFRHQRFPVGEINRGQLFDLTVSYEPDHHLYRFGELSASAVKTSSNQAQGPLAIHLRTGKDKAWLHCIYDEAYFNAEDIQALVERFTHVLEQVLDNPELAVGEVSLSTEADRTLLQQWNAEVPSYLSRDTIHGLFESRATAQPEATALIFEGEHLSYGELNRRANQLAHRLLGLGICPDDRVAICVERGLDMIIGLLGILKAGAGYVPIDPTYPQERIHYTLRDSTPMAVLVQPSTREVVGELSVPLIDLGSVTLQDESVANPQVPDLTSSHLAYVIYTSGSTGLPKGVMVEHRNVTRLLSATQRWFGFNERDVWALFHSFAFDFSVWEIWGALFHGGQLLVVPQLTSRAPDECYALLCHTGVTVLNQTPSAFRSLIAAQGRSGLVHSLRQVIFGGETLEPAILKPWYARSANAATQLVNMYGITETTVHVTYRALEAADALWLGSSPIGKRIADLRLYVLDTRGRPVPPGVEGELYVGGAGVARGYLNRPELNRERFLADPFDSTPGGRMYRTGDLGRWLADGSIDYLGRNDDQVKIRGFRIELGEIEARLAACDGVRDAVVIAREDDAGDKRLVAYLIASEEDGPNVADLRTQLLLSLADYMVPSAFVILERFPLTSHGKLDRKALPAPDAEAFARGDYEAPQGATEIVLARLWSELLGIERIGRHDQFFELGGHSLLAVKLIERMRQIGLSADVGVLFGQPTLAVLGAATGATSGVRVPVNTIVPDCRRITPDMLPLATLSQAQIDRVVETVAGGVANVQDIYALVPLQAGILFHHQSSTEGDPYLLQAVLRMDSRERLADFVEALQLTIVRHDILRTSVAWVGLDEPVQVVWRDARLPVQHVSINPALGDVATQLTQRFDARHTRLDLTRAPMMALHFAQDPQDGGWVAVLQFHHLIDDATSLVLLGQEIEAHLQGRGAQLAPSVPYRNYVAQARLGVSQAAHEAFFHEMLGDVDEPTLPFGLRDVQGDGQGIEQASQAVTPALGQRLRVQARRLGVSNASLYHLAWGQVVGRLSGRQDVVFGTVLMGRMSSGQHADRALGMFINTLPLRVEAGGQRIQAALKNTHARLAALLGHEHAPLSLAQRCSGVAAPTPLFSALLNYRHAAVGAPSAQEADKAMLWAGVQVVGGQERSNFPLMLSVDDSGEGFDLTVQAVAGVDPLRVCGYMHRVLEAVAEALETEADSPLHGLALLPEAERQLLLGDFNAFDATYPVSLAVHTLFEARVQHNPDAIAVSYQDWQLSYGELNALANQMAHHLIAEGIGVDDRVAICAERSLEMIVGLLAILKAGAGYVPLDPAYPDERLAYMLQDSTPKVLLTQQHLCERFAREPVSVWLLDPHLRAAQGIEAQAWHNPQVDGLNTESLAYVIYTSGSTGQPKGVAMPHGPLINLMHWQIAQTQADARPAQRTLQFAALGFDVAFQEVFSTLCAGGELSLVHGDVRLDFRQLFQHICQQRIQRLYLPCIALQALAEAVAEDPELARLPCALSDVISAGEQLRLSEPIRVLFQRLPGCRLHNHYGPTESHVTTALTLDGDAATWPTLPSIGVPLANTRIYLLDEQRQPVALGVAGEIYIGGACVARGYLNRDDLSAECFLVDPFVHQGRMYKTGDLGRYRRNGEIEYLGRNDGQIKIRGFRVELGEIEACLTRYAGVRDAAVLVREDSPGNKRLVAYFTAQAEPTLPEIDGLRAYLQVLLPDYMIPAAYVRLDKLPLSVNGKLDRRALPVPDIGAFASREYEAPQGATEIALAELWARVLEVVQVGRQDNFFELGGHSLLAVRLIEGMRQQGMSVDVRVLFGQPTLAALAAAVGGASEVQVPANGVPGHCARITPDMLPLISLSQDEIDEIVSRVPGGARNVQDIYPLAPLQQGILYHHITAEQGDPYLLQALLVLGDRVELEGFLHALQALIERHDILRTALFWEDLAQPVQVVLRHAGLVLEELELDPVNGAIRDQLHQRFAPRHARLDLSQAPSMRLVCAWDAIHQHWLVMLLFHHIAMDHTALEVMQQEILAYLHGRFDQLDAPMPYRNYVAQALLGVSQGTHEQFFREMLGDVDEPTLPFGLKEVQGDGIGVEEVKLQVDPDLSCRLRAQARQLGVSAASLHHLAWARVLASVSGRDDVVFGTVLLGRMQSGDGADRAMGMFINTLPLRIEVGAQDVRSGVRAVHARLSALLGHEHAPLVLAQRCSALPASSPLFSSVLNYRHSPLLESAGPHYWAGIEVLDVRERTNYPFALSVDDQGEAFLLSVQTTGVDARRVAAYMETSLQSLVGALESTPHSPLHTLPVLPAQELETLLEGLNNSAVDYDLHHTVHSLFEAQVLRTPDGVAVRQDDRQLSYRELNERANQLAYQLRHNGVQVEARVAICVERGIDMLVGLLAILKAGACYVPLDPTHPDERLLYLLEDSSPAALIVQRHVLSRLPALKVPVINLDHCTWQDPSVTNPDIAGLSAANLVYIIYTSGSTGLPKGVMVEHRSLANMVYWYRDRFELTPASQTSSVIALGFDAMGFEIWPALCSGATLHLPPAGGDKDNIDALLDWWCAQPLDVSLLPTPIAEYAMSRDRVHPTLRILNIGGDRLRHFTKAQRFELINNYGPTEATVLATSGWVEAGQAPQIGRPVANTRIYLLDSQRQPVPLGVAGELYIGGVQVARGYFNRPQLNVERFLDDPFSRVPGARMYRTGDMARYLADGNIEYLGRNDDQVKIRGFRIELGEIEAKLTDHPAVREAVVLAREDEPGEVHLVAYVTAQSTDDVPEAEALRAHLKTQLPDYMVPAAYVLLASLPLTTNHKIDRKALPAPDRQALILRAYEAPQGEIETLVAQIWEQLLNVERVGRFDHFFELGGHSLLAVKLIERMRQQGLSADVRVLFNQPTVEALAAAVGGNREVVVPANGIPPGCQRITPPMLTLVKLDQQTLDRIVASVPGGTANVQDIYPLAPLQKGILFHHLLAGQGDPYLLHVLFALDDRQHLEVFIQALRRVIERHDILRTCVLWEGLDEPVQVVWRQVSLSVEEVVIDDPGAAPEQVLQERFDNRHTRLDLAQAPLIRVAWHQDALTGQCLALLMFHHLVLDHTAVEVMRQEMNAYLQGQGETLGEAMPYRNYVAQAALGTSEQAQEVFFRDMLGDLDEPTLPFGLQEVRHGDPQMDVAQWTLDSESSLRLRAQARKLGVSAASLYHLGWALVLGKLCGREEVVFGTVLLGRMQGGEGADRAMGMFINTLPLRVGVDARSVSEGVKAVHARLSALLVHEHASLVLAQRCSGVAAPTPLFSALLNYRHAHGGDKQDPGTWHGARIIGAAGRTNYPLVLSVDDLGECFNLTLQTSAGVGAQRICRYMQTALAGLVEALERSPQTPLNRLSILSAAERAQLLYHWNTATAQPPGDHTLHGLFEAQAALHPEAIALQFEGQALTYGELNRQANQVAHRLLELGVLPDDRVALCVERGLAMIVGLLGILKAGAGYVPLDPVYPAERLAHSLRDSAPVAVLTQSNLSLADIRVPLILLDRPETDGVARQPRHNPLVPALRGSHLAYVIYTSGSTGLPKGVMVEHRNAVRLFSATAPWFGFDRQDTWALFHSFAFDFSVWEIWGALLHGGKLVIVPQRVSRSPQDFYRLLCDSAVTVLNQTPSAFRQLISAQGDDLRPHALRQVIFGGEVLEAALLKPWYARSSNASTQLVNMYGITETTVHVTYYPLVAADADRVGASPIGRCIPDLQLYVLDPQREPVPVGVAGELYVGGAGVARGYLNRPELTEARFIADPFIGVAGARLYRTGDLGRWAADGSLEYLGRNDDQVKIRGFRIELGEIQARLAACPTVEDALVIVREDSPGDKRLVGYVITQPGAVFSAAELRSGLLASLADYMVPGAFVQLEAFPLTANGKLDRQSLPVPGQGSVATRDYVAPQSRDEQAITAIWQEVLNLPQVGLQDDFFELGGDSIRVINLISRIQKAFPGSQVSIMAFYQAPTVHGLAALLTTSAEQVHEWLPELTRGPRDSALTLVCVPYAGASAMVFQPLAEQLRQRLPSARVYAVALLGNQMESTFDDSLDLMDKARACVGRIRERIDGPVGIYGHCAGSILAVEIARQLEQQGHEVSFVTLGGAFAPPVWLKYVPWSDPWRWHSDAALQRMIRAWGGASALNESALERLLRDFRRDSRLAMQHAKRNVRIEVRAPIVSVLSLDDPLTRGKEARYRSWQRCARVVHGVLLADGGHYFVGSRPAEVAEVILDTHYRRDTLIDMPTTLRHW